MKPSPVGIAMIGAGTVGSGVARLLSENAALYRRRTGRALELRRVLIRSPRKHARHAAIPRALLTSDPEAFFATPGVDIVVEVAGGTGSVGDLVHRAILARKHVVTANKSLLAAEGPEIFALARRHHVAVAFEASCCGGIPVITALQFGLMANRVDALYGILNGTCNYILTEMTRRGRTYADALADAQARGFAEADPTLDVSGADAAQKLAVLASLAFGARLRGSHVAREGIDRLDPVDIRFGAELAYDIKLLAIAERAPSSGHDGKLSLRVQPCFIHVEHPLAQVRSTFNALSVYGSATGQTLYYGRGAGQLPTASAVVSDILNIAAGWYPRAFSSMRLTADQHPAPKLIDDDHLLSRFYLRMNAKDVPGVMAKITAILGRAGISLSALMQHEAAAGKFVPVVITTHEAKLGALRRALRKIERLPVIQGRPACIRIVDMPVD